MPLERGRMPLDDIMSMWYGHDQEDSLRAGPTDIGIDPWTSDVERGDREPFSKGDSLHTAEDDQQKLSRINDDDKVFTTHLKLGTYRESILQTPAYQWLIADVQKPFRLMPILEALPSMHRVSRRNPPRPSKLNVVMPWDPVGFSDSQDYKEEAPVAIARAITLTGSPSAAQALTTSQYLRQTWPPSGQDIVELIQEVLRDTTGARLPVSRALSDGTVVTIWIEKSGMSPQPEFFAEATGNVYTLAQLGEQFAWIGAAIRSSPFPDGVACMQPMIQRLEVNSNSSKQKQNEYHAEATCRLTFEVRRGPVKQSKGGSGNGECWHNLFRNPVLVSGFPIARRPDQILSATGLEIPLRMMARLAKAKVVDSFCGRTVIKGFSTMLVPTRRGKNVIIWHLIHNRYGDRISYRECLHGAHPDSISSEQIQRSRHMVGWCTDARFLARFPFHVSRGGYIRKLKWISRKFVVLWDEEAKRGWLINGTSALLHLVRASLWHDSKDKFSSEFLFHFEDLQEAPPHAAYKPDSAIAVLLSHANRNLRIYAERDKYIVFEDRVEHYFRLMEQIIDHQVTVSGSFDAIYPTRNVSRADLEGWDFHDLAADFDPIHPRVAALSLSGLAWVELARSLDAVTLVGRGFGDIISSAQKSCPHWSTLPTGKYYLAVAGTDLIDIVNAIGDVTATPPRLTDKLVWSKSDLMIADAHCGCLNGDCDEHIDVVQEILPSGLATELQACSPHGLHGLENGAVIFGTNENSPWLWKETGDPVNDALDAAPEKPGVLSPSSDSGYGHSTEEEGSSIPMQEINLPAPAPSNHVRAQPLARKPVRAQPLARKPVRPRALARKPVRPLLNNPSVKAYTVGIVCALPLEMLAVRALFDVTHADEDGIPTPGYDSNHYTLGEMGKHKVVAACLPDGEYGTNSAANVAANMKRTFTSVQFALLVGIGGGVPSPTNDIRLGDVIVSKPTGTAPGVIKYDLGKIHDTGVFTQSGHLQAPPKLIMSALSNLRSDPHLSDSPLQEYLDEVAACRREYRYPGIHLDKLFASDYSHNPLRSSCDQCDNARLQARAHRPENHPRIHYGTIASGNCVIRDAHFRDHWAAQSNILCFEMEAAGIMNTIPCLVIRGICDYADSHKNKVFQHYAAATAASYAKLFL
ncbi:hypothetical protein BJX61DRAFT_548656 [Aspergillus egyptiacus]|nr:hypothetical protein BJX61DRAFT_548656 [Aspergillus egyptiacus]